MSFNKINISFLVFALSHFYIYSQDTSEIKLQLVKNKFIEGDTILLKIEFDLNKGDSTAYFYTFDFLYGIILTDNQGKQFREKTYFLNKVAFVISPEIPVRPNEITAIETILSCDYTTEENSPTFDYRCLVSLPPEIYTVKFDDYQIFRRFGKHVSANTLTFNVLSKK